MNIQYNIMIADIDKLNHNLEKMNILQLKWTLYILILKKNYKNKLNIKLNLIMNKFIIHLKMQFKF